MWLNDRLLSSQKKTWLVFNFSSQSLYFDGFFFSHQHISSAFKLLLQLIINDATERQTHLERHHVQIRAWLDGWSVFEFCCPLVAVLDNGEWNQQNIISDSNLIWSHCFNGPSLTHYTVLQSRVLLPRNIRANRNVSNKAAWFGDEKKEEVGFLSKKKQQKEEPVDKKSVT